MRAYEISPLYETSALSLGLYNPSRDEYSKGGSRPKLTLGELNRLKQIAKRREADLQKKLEFLPVMYGDPDREYQQRELELQKQISELEILKSEIGMMVDAAEIDQKQKAEITKKAMRAVKASSS